MTATSTKEVDYPADFVARVKRAYPNFESLHRHLDAGTHFVGRYLQDSQVSIDSEVIVDAFKDDEHMTSAQKLAALRVAAEEALVRDALYSEWCRITAIQRPLSPH